MMIHFHNRFALAVATVLVVLAVTTVLVTLGGCSGSWPGTSGSEKVNKDTWMVECGCIRRSGFGGSTVASTDFCYDGDEPSLWALNQVCDRFAFKQTQLGYGTSDDPVVCEPILGSDELVGEDNCPPTGAGRSEGLSSVSSAQLNAWKQPLHGWVNPHATYVGFVDARQSFVEIAVRGETARPAVTGMIYITGGDCPGANCSMRVDGLKLWADPFTLHGEPIDNVELVDWGSWAGKKYADDTYNFLVSDALLKLSASIGGDKGAIIGEPIGIPGGQFYGEAAPLPYGGVAPSGYMTIEGTFRIDEGEARVFLVLPFGNGAPRPVVWTNYVRCDVAGASECGWVFDASSSRDFKGRPVVEYRWYDAAGMALGSVPRLVFDSLYLPEPIVYPITLTVVSEDGFQASKTIGVPRPINADPPPTAEPGRVDKLDLQN